ncbi:hypothetical protein V8D89_015837 [Ganoderma adspersum]
MASEEAFVSDMASEAPLDVPSRNVPSSPSSVSPDSCKTSSTKRAAFCTAGLVVVLSHMSYSGKRVVLYPSSPRNSAHTGMTGTASCTVAMYGGERGETVEVKGVLERPQFAQGQERGMCRDGAGAAGWVIVCVRRRSVPPDCRKDREHDDVQEDAHAIAHLLGHDADLKAVMLRDSGRIEWNTASNVGFLPTPPYTLAIDEAVSCIQVQRELPLPYLSKLVVGKPEAVLDVDLKALAPAATVGCRRICGVLHCHESIGEGGVRVEPESAVSIFDTSLPVLPTLSESEMCTTTSENTRTREILLGQELAILSGDKGKHLPSGKGRILFRLTVRCNVTNLKKRPVREEIYPHEAVKESFVSFSQVFLFFHLLPSGVVWGSALFHFNSPHV